MSRWVDPKKLKKLGLEGLPILGHMSGTGFSRVLIDDGETEDRQMLLDLVAAIRDLDSDLSAYIPTKKKMSSLVKFADLVEKRLEEEE